MAVDFKNLIDIDLLAYFKTKLDLIFTNKVDKETGKGLSSNDFTSAEKTKLANVAEGAQANVIEGIQTAGTTISPTNKIVNIPTATTSAPGVMSGDDKTKLNGIETGAEKNVVTNAATSGSGASETLTVSKGATNYLTYTKSALDTALGAKANANNVYCLGFSYATGDKGYLLQYKYNYSSLKPVDLNILTQNELRVINDTINRNAHMKAGQISEYSHGDIPWRITSEGEELNYESVFYRDPEYSVRDYDD